MSAFDTKSIHESLEEVKEVEGINDDKRVEELEEISSSEAGAVLAETEPVRIEKDLGKATQAKERGNEFFRTKEYEDAIEEYSSAISLCPEDAENHGLLSVLYGNRGACYFAEEDLELAIEDCTKSLEYNPEYVKVLIRRSQCYEKLDRIDEALQDSKKVQGVDPTYPKINDTVRRLEKLSEEKLTKLKDEALGKLKDLGNSILGNFGMSLDNFKMTQDPATGGWSISMNNGK